MDDFIGVRVITYIKHRNRFIQHIKNFIKSKQIKIKKSKVKHGFSRGENTIWNLLKQHTIKFEFQKRFSDCKDKNTLLFDFFIPKYNLCIEFQGSQHYDPGFYIRKKKSQEEGMKKYLIQKKHDEIKKNYCIQNNINFLEIKYTEKIEDKLKEALLW